MSEALSKEEQAYFDTQGEADFAQPAVKPVEQEAAEQEAAEPEVEAEAPETEQEGRPEPKTVPLKALHEERRKAKEASERAAAAEAKIKALDDRLNAFFAGQQRQQVQPEAAQETIPDPDQDVFEASKYTLKQVEELKRQQAEFRQQQQAEAARVQVDNAYRAAAQAYKETVPDFTEAYNHLMKSWDHELTVRGITDPATRMQMIQNEERNVAYALLKQGRNPAEAAYEMSKARGYAPKSKEVPAAEKLDTIARGQAASTTLSGKGAPTSATMTVERLIGMSEKEFAAYDAKNPDLVKRLMGQ